ncbi:hypothetical protein [Clostridium sp.]
MLLFTSGLFLLALLTFIVLLIDKTSKNSSSDSQLEATVFYKTLVIPVA